MGKIGSAGEGCGAGLGSLRVTANIVRTGTFANRSRKMVDSCFVKRGSTRAFHFVGVFDRNERYAPGCHNKSRLGGTDAKQGSHTRTEEDLAETERDQQAALGEDAHGRSG